MVTFPEPQKTLDKEAKEAELKKKYATYDILISFLLLFLLVFVFILFHSLYSIFLVFNLYNRKDERLKNKEDPLQAMNKYLGAKKTAKKFKKEQEKEDTKVISISSLLFFSFLFSFLFSSFHFIHSVFLLFFFDSFILVYNKDERR